jgi:hypothetical protein
VAHSLNVYYEAEHADRPVVVDEPGQVRSLLADVRRRYPQGSAVLITVVLGDDPWGPELSIGLDGGRGVVRYAGHDHPAGVYSRNPTPSNTEPVIYYYVTADTEFPPDAEVPTATVEAAMTEFLTTGGKLPTVVEWQRGGNAQPQDAPTGHPDACV